MKRAACATSAMTSFIMKKSRAMSFRLILNLIDVVVKISRYLSSLLCQLICASTNLPIKLTVD